jgi:regulator of protease activity HflC (stomatin/prohibitin superfamily)
VAHFNAEQLLKDREHVRQQIVDLLKAKLAAYDLVLEDIQLTDFKFDQSFEQAIEAKQVAEQQALTEKNNLQKAEILAQQKVASAQGEANAQLAIAKANAEAIRLQGDALRANPAYLELKKLDKWDGSLPHYVGSGADHVLIGIDGAK